MFGKSQMSQSKRKRDDGLHSKRDVLHDEIMQIWEKHPQSPTSYSIYMVPRTLRRLKPRAYTPRIVSIGLIHAKDPHVQPMNVHKESYMCSLFKRTAISEETRDLCVDAMADEAERAGECYHPSVRFDDTIARTMLVDGCFLLELLMRSSRIKHNWRRPYDPIFGDDFKVRDVVHDLLLLENQIPFFILEHLFGHTFERIQNRPNGSLRHLILEFFGNIMNSKFELKIEDGENEKAPDHILGLLHSCYRPDVSDPGDYAIRKYSATELHRSGVNFKPKHVELLEREEVLQNYLGTGEDASDLFNNLCKGVILGEFYFSKQWEQVDHYCKLYWPSCIASLRRTYFSSPWTGISVVAAFILFAFTGIQAICSLISL